MRTKNFVTKNTSWEELNIDGLAYLVNNKILTIGYLKRLVMWFSMRKCHEVWIGNCARRTIIKEGDDRYGLLIMVEKEIDICKKDTSLKGEC